MEEVACRAAGGASIQLTDPRLPRGDVAFLKIGPPRGPEGDVAGDRETHLTLVVGYAEAPEEEDRVVGGEKRGASI